MLINLKNSYSKNFYFPHVFYLYCGTTLIFSKINFLQDFKLSCLLFLSLRFSKITAFSSLLVTLNYSFLLTFHLLKPRIFQAYLMRYFLFLFLILVHYFVQINCLKCYINFFLIYFNKNKNRYVLYPQYLLTILYKLIMINRYLIPKLY